MNTEINPVDLDAAAIAHAVNNQLQPPDRIRRSNVPRELIIATLVDTKQKSTARIRRGLNAALEYLSLRPQTAPIDPAVKMALNLQKLTLRQLIRRRAQSARRAATAKYLLEKMAPGSRFRPPVAAEQTHQLGIFKQVQAEIDVRTQPRPDEYL